MLDDTYKLLIEEIKYRYICAIGRGGNKFSYRDNKYCKCIRNSSTTFDVEKNFDIRETHIEDDRVKQIIKFDIRSKFNEDEWNVLLVPTRFLFSKNMVLLRKEMIERCCIKSIITLKNSFFEEYTVPASLIVLGEPEGEICLTSAARVEDVINVFLDSMKYHRKVYFTKYLNAESFMPEFYNNEIKKINEKLDKYDTRELQEIAEIISGKNVMSQDFSDSGIPYLRVRNIQNGVVCGVDTYVNSQLSGKYAKQLLQEGDLLLSKNFGQHKIAKINESVLPALPSSNFFIIRAFGVPEDYLYQYFTSKTGNDILNKQLSSIEHGETIKSICLGDLKKLRVPIYDNATMINMGNVEEASAYDIIKGISLDDGIKDPLEHGVNTIGRALEEKVYSQFLNNGWTNNEVLLESQAGLIKVDKHINWIPDIVLMDGEKKLAVVEVRRDIYSFNSRLLRKLKAVIYSGNYPFLILATEGYFEIHGKSNSIIKKSTMAPSKEELMHLLKEEEA